MAIKLLQQRTKNLKYVQSCAQGRIKTVGGHNLCVCVGGGGYSNSLLLYGYTLTYRHSPRLRSGHLLKNVYLHDTRNYYTLLNFHLLTTSVNAKYWQNVCRTNKCNRIKCRTKKITLGHQDI